MLVGWFGRRQETVSQIFISSSSSQLGQSQKQSYVYFGSPLSSFKSTLMTTSENKLISIKFQKLLTDRDGERTKEQKGSFKSSEGQRSDKISPSSLFRGRKRRNLQLHNAVYTTLLALGTDLRLSVRSQSKVSLRFEGQILSLSEKDSFFLFGLMQRISWPTTTYESFRLLSITAYVQNCFSSLSKGRN